MSSKLRDRGSEQLELAQGTVTVKVRESPRAKTSRILVGLERPLEIIVPADTSTPEVRSLLRARRSWIEDKLQLVEEERSRPAALGLDQPGVVWLEGQALPITHAHGPALVRKVNGEVSIAEAARGAQVRALESFYRREARSRLRAVATEEAERLGLSFESVAVRDQRTRWGSCSSKGNLSFNWRLVVAPAQVLRYVVVHELCHLAVPNHSKPFWRRLEAAHPGWQQPAAWLREHGAELRAYSPSVALD